jgi:hypothetical protein
MESPIVYFYDLTFHLEDPDCLVTEFEQEFDGKFGLDKPKSSARIVSGQDFHVFYFVKEARPLDVVVADIENIIRDYDRDHGIVTLALYTNPDVNQTHFFVMPDEGGMFTEVTNWEFEQVTIGALGLKK